MLIGKRGAATTAIAAAEAERVTRARPRPRRRIDGRGRASPTIFFLLATGRHADATSSASSSISRWSRIAEHGLTP